MPILVTKYQVPVDHVPVGQPISQPISTPISSIHACTCWKMVYLFTDTSGFRLIKKNQAAPFVSFHRVLARVLHPCVQQAELKYSSLWNCWKSNGTIYFSAISYKIPVPAPCLKSVVPILFLKILLYHIITELFKPNSLGWLVREKSYFGADHGLF